MSITEACRTFGISRTTYYRWADRARRYSLAALMPKARRSPAMPNTTAPEIVEIVVAEAIVRPTLGARRQAAPASGVAPSRPSAGRRDSSDPVGKIRDVS
jgi:transposase-like protein